MTEKNTTDALLHRIANHLIMNASFLDDLGLYHGKMGIVLFFAHYAKYTSHVVYDEFANELFYEIYKEIHAEYPFNFENGLCGIGWGIEYLCHNNFLDGDCNDILYEIDRKLEEWNVFRNVDETLETGKLGWLYYVDIHVSSIVSGKSCSSFLKENYLLTTKERIVPLLSPKKLLLTIVGEKENVDISIDKLGLRNGIAGWAIKKMLS